MDRFEFRRLLLSALLMLVPCAAGATHITVRVDGSGDVPTFAAGVDAILLSYVADTLVVEPGFYDEVVVLPVMGPKSPPFLWEGMVLVCPGGPALTRVRAITTLPQDLGNAYLRSHIEGLGVVDYVALGYPYSGQVWWEGCTFEGGYSSAGSGGNAPPTHGCTFMGRTEFPYNCLYISDCTFISAPVFAFNSFGDLIFERCTFIGPTDTLMTANTASSDNMIFNDCTFRNAAFGIVGEEASLDNYGGILVNNSTFIGMTRAGIAYRSGEYFQGMLTALRVAETSFDSCNRAIDWVGGWRHRLELKNVRATQCDSGAIRLSVWGGTITGLDITDSGGIGLELTVSRDSYVAIESSTIAGSAKAGLVLTPGADLLSDPSPQGFLRLTNTRLEANGGPGVIAIAPTLVLDHVVSRLNGGAGIAVTLSGSSDWRDPAPSCSLRSSTVHGNRGDGITLSPGPGGAAAALTIENNLVTNNGGVGLYCALNYSGAIQHNDAWLNRGVAYVGVHPADSNLQLDPLYCAVEGGDYTLRSPSPCAPSGVYGQIGYFGVGCGALADAPPSITLSELRATPNPARQVVFVNVNGTHEAGEVRVFDLQGRVAWRQTVPAGASTQLRWDGQTVRGGRAAAGVYLAQFLSPGRVMTTRFTWLSD